MILEDKSCNVAALAFFIALSSISLSAHAQDPLVTLPNNYRSVLDNSEIAVIRAHYGAQEKIPVHDHTSFATIFVYLSDSGVVRIDHAENGKAESVMRPPTTKGAYRIAPGIAERHSIENLGDTSSDFLRVELKHVTLDLKEPFRGKAPTSLAKAQDAIEFTAPGLQVERIVCLEGTTCQLKPFSGPSLLIPFTAAGLSAGSSASEKLDAGEIRWQAPSANDTISPRGGPAHLLRILLPPTSK